MKEKEVAETSDFSCVLIGEVMYLEEIKDYIIQEYASKGLVTLVNSSSAKNEMHILTDDQWKEYQKLKERDEKNLIGAGFP